MEELLLALQGATRLMEHRLEIDEIVDYVPPTENREEVHTKLSNLLGAIYMAGMNDGLELAANKLEDRLRELGHI